MPSERPLRIAAYGFVDRDAGSVASASFVILSRLLDRGHSVDFFAIRGFIRPAELFEHPNFRYQAIGSTPIERVWRFLENSVPSRLRGPASLVWSQVSNAVTESEIGRAIRRLHDDSPYDVLLCLGLLSPFAVPGLAQVSWPQGAPNGEWEALQSRRDQIVESNGQRFFLMLKLGYAYKIISAKMRLPRSNAVVCGSSWSVGNWEKLGAKTGTVHAIPYPFDLDRFRPSPEITATLQSFRFLCLGRIVPRKRVDLLLDAFEVLRKTYPEARLLVIGRFAYAKGFSTLIDRMTVENGVEYREWIDRSEVPALLQAVDAVVQPSENEDIGSSVLEGLACGKGAVLGPTNGTKDYVGASSIVFEAYTPEALANGLARMIEAVRSENGRVATEARASAEEYLDADRVVDRLLQVVESARRMDQ